MTRRLAPLLMLSLAACSGVTEIVVDVSVDLAVPAELDEVRVAVSGLAVGPTAARSVHVRTREDVPVRVTVVHRGGPYGPLTIDAVGLRQGVEVSRRSATTSFSPGRSLVLALALEGDCGGRGCAEDAGACGADGGCAPPAPPPPTPTPTPDGGMVCPAERTCASGCACAGADCDCHLTCEEGTDCGEARCEHGATCEVDAARAERLELECRGGASCVVDARHAEDVTVRCEATSRCDVDCERAGTCRVLCEGEATCTLSCRHADDCWIEGCADGGLRACPGDVRVCNAGC